MRFVFKLGLIGVIGVATQTIVELIALGQPVIVRQDTYSSTIDAIATLERRSVRLHGCNALTRKLVDWTADTPS